MSHSDVGNPVPIAPFAWSRAAKLEGLQYRFSPSKVDAADGLCVLVFPHLPSTSSVPLTLTLGRTSSKQYCGTVAASPGQPEKNQQSGSSFVASPNIPRFGCPESPGTAASPSSTSYGHRQWRSSVPPATGCSSPQNNAAIPTKWIWGLLPKMVSNPFEQVGSKETHKQNKRLYVLALTIHDHTDAQKNRKHQEPSGNTKNNARKTLEFQV